MRDDTLEVTVPATTLRMLAALAGGYRESRGQFISRNHVNDAYRILDEAGYEYGDDTLPLFDL